jgi:flagellar biosynthesis/type III secretory pathway chaperone
MLNSLIVAYAQFVKMLIELKEVLSQEQMRLYSKAATVLLEWFVPKPMDFSLLHYYYIRNK